MVTLSQRFASAHTNFFAMVVEIIILCINIEEENCETDPSDTPFSSVAIFSVVSANGKDEIAIAYMLTMPQ